MKTGFIGAGKVGCSLGKFLSVRGIEITGYFDRDTTYAEEAAQFTQSKAFATARELVCESDVVFITVPDGLISRVFNEIKTFPIEGKYICHCSGSISSRDAFAGIGETGAYEYSVHPLFAVSDRFETYRELADAFFTLEGNPAHLDEMSELLTKAGMTFQIIDPASKTRYHLAAVYSSNLLLALLGQGILLLQECGFSEEDARKALEPLITGNVQHALQAGPAKALTGPVERGDAGTLEKHLSVMEDEEDRQLYLLLSKKLVELAKVKNPDRDYAQLELFIQERKDQ